MELLYIWIKDYKNIKNQGFNFSPRWRFKYDVKSGILDIEDRNETVIEDFFGKNIINVTAIVGENGVGKSNLLEFILTKLKEGTGFWDSPFLIIFRDKQKIKIWYHKTIALYVTPKDDFEIGVEQISFEMKKSEDIDGLKGGFKRNSEVDKIQPIYLNTFFDGNNKIKGLKNDRFYDMSTNRLLLSSLGEANDLIPDFKIEGELPFHNFEVRRQVIFLCQGGHNLVDINLPNYLKITPQFKKTIERIERFFIRKNLGGKLVELKKIDDFFSKANTLTQVYAELILSTIYETLTTSIIGQDYFENLVTQITNLEIEKGYEEIKFPEVIYIISYKSILDLLNWLKDKEGIIIDKFHKTLSIPLEKTEDFFRYIDFINFQFMSPFSFNWIFKVDSFSGTLSTGESALVSLLARIYVIRTYLTRKYPIIIFIDEGEMSLHPRFQQKYVQLLIKNIPLVLNSQNRQPLVQIILTSHSPFVVSDLPKENIIFLSKNNEGNCQVVNGLNEKKQTFGANIHTLLTDSFFMDGLVGDFAQEKINEVIEFINDYPNNKTITLVDAKKIVNMIGEPILKKHLQQQIKLIEIGKANKNEEDIGALKQRIHELEIALKKKIEN